MMATCLVFSTIAFCSIILLTDEATRIYDLKWVGLLVCVISMVSNLIIMDKIQENYIEELQ